MFQAIRWLTIVWTFLAFVGCLVSFGLLFSAWNDLLLLKHKHINSWRQYVAFTSVLIFFAGFSTMIIYFVTGLISLDHPPHYVDGWRIFNRALFLFGSASSITLSIVIFYRRHKIIDMLELYEIDKEHKESEA